MPPVKRLGNLHYHGGPSKHSPRTTQDMDTVVVGRSDSAKPSPHGGGTWDTNILQSNGPETPGDVKSHEPRHPQPPIHLHQVAQSQRRPTRRVPFLYQDRFCQCRPSKNGSRHEDLLWLVQQKNQTQEKVETKMHELSSRRPRHKVL